MGERRMAELTFVNDPRSGEGGTILVEALIAMCILTIGLLGMAQVFALGLSNSSTSTAALIAREKAREAIESVHTARDTRTITWAQIRNVSQGGVFLDGPQPLRMAGPDNLVNTADDCAAVSAQQNCPAILESIQTPGPDNQLGTADDVRVPLNNFTREIRIEDVAGNPALRRLTITVRYTVGRFTPPPYTLVTFVSSFA